MTLVYIRLELHCITLHCIALRAQHSWWISSCICVRGHANAWSQMKPSGMDAAGFEGEGGRGAGSQFDMINHAQQGGPKTSSTWKIMEATSSLPASKQAFVICVYIYGTPPKTYQFHKSTGIYSKICYFWGEILDSRIWGCHVVYIYTYIYIYIYTKNKL